MKVYLTLQCNERRVTIELPENKEDAFDGHLNIDCVFEELIAPALLGVGFSKDLIEEYIND